MRTSTLNPYSHKAADSIDFNCKIVNLNSVYYSTVDCRERFVYERIIYNYENRGLGTETEWQAISESFVSVAFIGP